MVLDLYSKPKPVLSRLPLSLLLLNLLLLSLLLFGQLVLSQPQTLLHILYQPATSLRRLLLMTTIFIRVHFSQLLLDINCSS